MSIQMAVRSLGQAIALGELHIVSDADLLRQFVNSRDEESFRKLIERHGPIVKAVCLRSCGDRQLSEDAFQKTFLELARKASKIRTPEALSGWLYKVAHRVGLKNRKRKTSQPLDQADQSTSVLDRMSARELLDLVDAEIVKLPDHYRSALIACSIEERSIEEAAERFHTTPHAVRGWLQRGREQLRKRLKWHGVELSIALTALAACSESQITASDMALAATTLANSSTSSISGPLTLVLSRAKSPWIIAATAFTVCLAGWGIIASTQANSKHENGEPKQNQADVFTAASNIAKFDPIPPKKDSEPPLPEGAVARFGSTRMRSTMRSHWLSFSQDGKYLYSTAGRGDEMKSSGIEVWDLATGRIKQTIRYGQMTEAASINSDGKTMTLIVTDNGKNPELGTPVDLPKSGGDFSPLVAHRVELSTGKILKSSRLVRPVSLFLADNHAISSDGSLLATLRYGDNQPICVFSTETGLELCRIEKRPEAKSILPGFVFSNDNRHIIFEDRGNQANPKNDTCIHFHDVKTGALVKRITVKEKLAMYPKVSNDGKLLSYIYYANSSLTVCIVDIETSRKIIEKTYPSHSLAYGAFFTPDGKGYVLSSVDFCIVADVKDGQERFCFPYCYYPSGPAISPDGTLFATSQSNLIGIWSLKTGEPYATSADPFDPNPEMIFTPHGTLLALSDSIVEHDLKTGQQTKHSWPIKGIHKRNQEIISPDGSHAAIWWQNDEANVPVKDHEIIFLDLKNRRELSRLKMPSARICSGQFTKDHRFLYLNMTDDQFKTYPFYRIDEATGKVASQLMGAKGKTYQMELSDDGRFMATYTEPLINESSVVRIWDVKTEKPIREFRLTSEMTDERKQRILKVPTLQPINPSPQCKSLKFLPNGQLMIQTLPYWQDLIFMDPETGKEIDRVSFAGEQAFSVSFSPDSRKMYYREQQPDTSESSIKIMDRATKKVTTVVGKSMSKQNTILASPDGRWLATNDELGVGYLWDMKKLMPKVVEPVSP